MRRCHLWIPPKGGRRCQLSPGISLSIQRGRTSPLGFPPKHFNLSRFSQSAQPFRQPFLPTWPDQFWMNSCTTNAVPKRGRTSPLFTVSPIPLTLSTHFQDDHWSGKTKAELSNSHSHMLFRTHACLKAYPLLRGVQLVHSDFHQSISTWAAFHNQPSP